MKKGFTLVELLGVVVILAILATIVVPVATTLIGKSVLSLNDVQLSNIKTGAVSWATDHISDVPGTSSTYNAIEVSLNTLIAGGYIPSDIKDLTTKNNYSDIVNVVITYGNNRLSYDIYNGTKVLSFDQNRALTNGYLYSSSCYVCTKASCTANGTFTSNICTYTDGIKLRLYQ